MFTELLQGEVWRKRLEAAGFRVLGEAWDRDASDRTNRYPPGHAAHMVPALAHGRKRGDGSGT